MLLVRNNLLSCGSISGPVTSRAKLEHMGRTPGRVLACFTAWLLMPLALLAADWGKELLDAAAQGHTANVQELIGKGAPLESTDKNGRTALMLAAQHGHAATVRVLLEKGANATARDQTGATAWVLAMFSPTGARTGAGGVLQLLPRPPRPKVAVEAVWTTNHLYNSCIMRPEQLTQLVSDLEPDRKALTAFRRYSMNSGKDLIEISATNARGVAGPDDAAFANADAVLILTVRPGAACVPQQGADSLSLTLEVQLLRAKDRTVLLRKNLGGGLKSLLQRVVTGQAQYSPVYEELAKPFAEQAYWAAVESWFRAE